MTSIGETLRRERLRRNLGLDQISRELKISSKLLEAIEAEEFDKLPGTIFAKNFVRQYAKLLGLDEEEMAAEVQRALQPPPELPNFAQSSKAAPPEKLQPPPIQLPRVEDWESASDRGFSWSSPLPALALFVVAMLVCSGVYAWYQRTRHPVLAQNQNTSASAAQSTQPVAEPPAAPPQETTPTAVETAQQQTPAPVPAPSQATPASAPAPNNTEAAAPVRNPETIASKPVPPPPATPDSTAPSGPVTVRVQITAEEPSWVLVRSDGKFLFSGTMEANQTRTVEASRNMELRLGNAGGVNVVLNGNSIGAVGPKGQVRTVQFTSGGFQIVAAPKSAPPDVPR